MAVAAEEMRDIGARLPVDGDGEDADAGAARLDHRHAGILHGEAALVVVDVVGLAVGQDEQQLAPVGPRLEPHCCMADRGADTGVVAGLQRGDARLDRRPHRLVEALHRLDPDPVAPARGEGQDLVVVAAGGEPMGEDGQCLFLHIEHTQVVEPGIGRERDIHQRGHGEVMRLRPARQMDAVAAGAAGGEIGLAAHHRVEIEVGTVDLAALRLAQRAQSLEPAADLAHQRARRGVLHRGGLLLLRHSGEHAAMVVAVACAAEIPFRIGQGARQCRFVHRFRRQVEIEAEARGRAALALAQHHVVELVGGLGFVLLAVVGGAVDRDHLGHRQDRLEAVEGEGAALAPILGRLVAAGGIGLHLLLGLRRGRRRLVLVAATGAGGGGGARQGPERHAERRQIAGRGLGEPVLGGDLDGLATEQGTDQGLDLGLGRGQALAAPTREQGVGQSAIGRAETGKGSEDPCDEALCSGDQGEVALERIGFGGRPRRHRGHAGGEPDIEIAVEPWLREERDLSRQLQAVRRAQRLRQPFLAKADALAQVEPVAGGAFAGRDDPDAGLAAEAAEADGERRRHACQRHRSLRVMRQARGVADQAVPEAPDRLFQLEEVQHRRAP